MSRSTAYQVGLRVMQGIKDQAAKLDNAIRSAKDSSSSSSSASKHARKFSGTVESTAGLKAATKADKIKQAEESLRTVMYLSCWGPN